MFCKFLVHACGRGALTQLQCSYYQFPRSISLSAMPSGSFYLSILMSCQIPFLAMLKVKHRMRAQSNSTSCLSLVMYDVILDPMYDDFHRKKCLTSGEAERWSRFPDTVNYILLSWPPLFSPGACFSCLIFTQYCGHCRSTLPLKDYLTFRIYIYFPPAAFCSVFWRGQGMKDASLMDTVKSDRCSLSASPPPGWSSWLWFCQWFFSCYYTWKKKKVFKWNICMISAVVIFLSFFTV